MSFYVKHFTFLSQIELKFRINVHVLINEGKNCNGASETYDRIQNFGAFAEKEHLPQFV